MGNELKPIWDWMSDIDFSKTQNIPDWVDPREPIWINKGKSPMPDWIKELADWSMRTGNYNKIDKLLDLRFDEQYNTKWTPEQINEFKYGVKYRGLPKAQTNNKFLITKYLDAINPKEVFHRDPDIIFNKFDISKAGIRKDGSKYNLNFGKGGYVSTANDLSLDKIYGDKVSRFFINPESKFTTPSDIYKSNILEHPYFNKEEIYGKRFQDYLKRKGYSGINNKWEIVSYNPNKDFLPANTKLQRIANKFFNNAAVRYGSELLNRIAIPAMIIDGLSQPAGQGSDIIPQYPVNGMLKGYITNSDIGDN